MITILFFTVLPFTNPDTLDVDTVGIDTVIVDTLHADTFGIGKVVTDTDSICEYKHNFFEEFLFPFVLSAIFPPSCPIYGLAVYQTYSPRCKDLASKKAQFAISSGIVGSIAGLLAFTALLGGQDIAILGCASIAFPELRLNCISGEPSCGSSGGDYSSGSSCGDCSGGSSGGDCSGGSSGGDCSGGSSGSDCSGGSSGGDCSGGSSGGYSGGDCGGGGGTTTTTTCITSPKVPTPVPPYTTKYLFRDDICAYTGKGCR